MNQQDKAFMTAFSAVLGVLVVIAILCFIIASSVASSGLVRDEDAVKLALTKRIAPVGRVVMAGSAEAEEAAQQATAAAAETEAAAAGDMSGEAVYAASCNACHGTNFPNAPQLGNKEQWQPRFDKGLDQLVSSAVNGINTMPAKGGNAALSEQNIKDAVVYILNQSGFDMAADTADASGSDEKPAEEGQSQQQAQAEQSEEKAAAAGAVSQAAAAPAELDLAQGEDVYNNACGLCHNAGVANAPKLGDKNSWGTRLGQDFDTLAAHAINGLNTMPAKGGRMDLSDDDVKTAVAYMLDALK